MLQKVKIFIKKYKKESIAFSLLFFSLLIFFIGNAFAALEPVRSIIITSEKTSYTNSEEGAWQVEKSGSWIKKGTAEVSFNVDTILKTNNKYTDIIFVLDISGSMSGEKLDRVKSDTTQLVESLLSNTNNRAALITFDTNSSILSDLTNDKDSLVEKINALQDTGSTNYYQALRNVEALLQNYEQEQGRELVVLFLTDGYPNIDTPNQITQFQYLKQQYPYITLNGIQYEMGSSVLTPIKEISDNQFIADMNTLNNVLFDASVTPVTYEKYEIIDYIDNRYFIIESKDDIEISQGKVKLEEEDGKQKITWTMTDLKSGNSAKITMKLKLKDELLGKGGIYPTNEKEEVITKIGNEEEDVKSSDTPVLADNYQVIYDGNAPEGCTVKNVPGTNQHSVFDTVEISSQTPSCEGYQFKGWEIVTEEVTKVNDDYFIMPERDVTIRATWSELKLAKSMDGTISKVQTLYKMMQDQAVMDNVASEFVSSSNGINFSSAPSNTNGKGIYARAGTENNEYPIYYYRGEIDNNHVKFAGFCWKIVRTTETGGVKLIYDGVPDSNGYCNNTGTASQIGTSAFNSSSNSPADVGYMYGTRYTYSSRNMGTSSWYSFVGKSTTSLTLLTSRSGMSSTNYYYGDSISYDEATGTYSLTNPTLQPWSDNYNNLRGRYTCFSATATSCTNPSYIGGSSSSTAYYRPVGQEKIGLGQNVVYQDGMYTISDYQEIDAVDYYSNYSSYKGYYLCSTGTTNTCSEISYMNTTSSASTSRVVMSNGETYDSLVEQANNTHWVYGNDVSWDSSTYTLVDTITSSPMAWSSDRSKLAQRYHYTCLSTDNTCSRVYYIHYFGNSSNIYYLTLSNGSDIESAKDEMFTNTTSSRIKTTIDTWYAGNMTEYTKYLEDTIWCNDRSFYSGSLKGKDVDAGTGYSYFGAYGNNVSTKNPSVSCPNVNDSFTVSSENGNGALDYPVALLTADELTLAGHGWNGYSRNAYLYTGQYYWSLSPYYFDANDARGFVMNSNGYLNNDRVYSTNGVRPSVSLAPGIMISGGDGTSEDPYQLELEE